MGKGFKRFPRRIRLANANIAEAIMKLHFFSAARDIEEISQDIGAFLSNLNWGQIQKDIPNEFYSWPGNEWVEEILEGFDQADEISKKALAALNPILSDINLSAKYFFSWQIIQAIYATKLTNSYELIFESTEELACSFLLMKGGFYKQAFQALRNYLEVCVSILYFSVYENAYDEWLNNDKFYHFPKFHKDEKYHEDMLTKLGEFLDGNDIRFMSEQYEKLNSSVHSRRHRINMNLGRLQRSENDFGAQDIKYWSDLFNKIVRFMVILFLKALFISSTDNMK